MIGLWGIINEGDGLQGMTNQGKHPGGRPRKLTIAQQAEIFRAFEQYIDCTADPTLVDFVASDETAKKYRVSRDNVNDLPEFTTLKKRAIDKQEAYLLRAGGNGTYNSTLAIFRLKQPQHGYHDRHESDITSGGDKLGVGLSADQAEQLIRARANRSNI